MPARSGWQRAFERLLPLHLFTLLCLSVVEPNDFWWHLRYARTALETHAFPDLDAMSFVTQGQRFVDQQWLSQMTLYEAYVHGGLALVIVVHALAITLGYALVWDFARRRVGAANAAVATILCAAIGGAHWGVRPQTFSFLCFGILVRILDSHAAGKRRVLWLAVPLFAVWANVHGIYTVGWLVVGVHVGVMFLEAARARGVLAALRDERSTLAAAVCCVLAGAVNPHGVRGLIEHVLQFVNRSHGIIGGAEFDPMSVRRLDGLVFLYGVGRLVYACFVTGWKPPLPRIAVLVVMGVFAMAVVRVEPWFGMLLLTPLAEALDRESKRGTEAPPVVRTPVAVGVVLLSVAAAIAALPWFRSALPLPPSRKVLASLDTPVDATTVLCAHAHEGERVFADQAFASYVEFACPEVLVFVDTRVTPFDATAWDQYSAVTGGRFDQERILEGWRVDALLLRTDQTAGLAALAERGAWKEVHRDASAVLLLR